MTAKKPTKRKSKWAPSWAPLKIVIPSFTVATAPRDQAELERSSAALYRLGLELELFPDEHSERTFICMPKEDRAKIILEALLAYDRTNPGKKN